MYDFLTLILIALGAILIGMALFYGYHWLLRRRSAEEFTTADLQPIIRKVQVVDVREPAEFDAGHILGARNIPYSQFNVRFSELRRDVPIYLYDDALASASRAANALRKNGYSDVYVLKGGFSEWTGKVKSNL